MAFYVYVIMTLFAGCHQSIGLRLTNMIVPVVADVRDEVTLSCSYYMGNHTLNSVKWYKDKNEFFRFAPLMYENIMTFPVVGITLSTSRKNFCNKETCIVNLMKLGPKTSGSYRCEVSGDAPEFKLIDQTANMTIAALPKHDPIISVISGAGKLYTIGEFIIANCTSDMSSPPSVLYWFINDELAPSEFLEQQQETTVETDGFTLSYKSLEIRFPIDKTFLVNSKNIIKLKCLANIVQIPSAIRESTRTLHIRAIDDLKNQKLINWRNSEKGLHQNSTNFILLFITLIGFVCSNRQQ